MFFLLASVPAAADEKPVYRLQVGDQIKFVVWNESSLGAATEVLEDGSITFPLVGRLVVEGLTLAEVEEECRIRLQTYLLDPIASVIVTSPHVPRVKVLGKVKDPGKYNLRPGDTLIDAIAYAGGFEERCDIRHILILSREGGKIVNLKGYLEGDEGFPGMDIAMYDGDLVFVPETGRPDWDSATDVLSGIIRNLIVLAAG
jgi:polysaccharide export outer membrane protein